MDSVDINIKVIIPVWKQLFCVLLEFINILYKNVGLSYENTYVGLIVDK